MPAAMLATVAVGALAACGAGSKSRVRVTRSSTTPSSSAGQAAPADARPPIGVRRQAQDAASQATAKRGVRYGPERFVVACRAEGSRWRCALRTSDNHCAADVIVIVPKSGSPHARRAAVACGG
jgi:hypothetical protein